MIDKLTLSPTSIRDFYNCQRRWYYIRYLRIPIPYTGRQVLGTSYHNALSYAYRQRAVGNTIDLDDVVNSFSLIWSFHLDNYGINWQGENPDELFNSGVELLKIYVNDIMPLYTPIDVNKRISIQIGEVELVGYPDAVCVDGDDIIVIENKIGKRRMSNDDVKKDVQITSYGRLLNRPIRGEIHYALRQKKPRIEIIKTTRDIKDYTWFDDWVSSTWRTIKLAKEFLPNPNWWGCKEPSDKGGCEVWELCHLE